MSASLKGDLAQARRHVELLTGSPDTPVYGRLIYERTKEKRPAENHFGTVADLWPAIEDAQQRGFAAYIQVNEALPPDRLQEPVKLSPKAGEIVRVRALVADKDGDKHRELWAKYYTDERGAGVRWQDQDWHVQPDFLVIRDETHYHPYWLARDLPTIQFRHFEGLVAHHYGADPAVIDLPRILRLAGTWHQKPGKPPSMVTLHVPEWTEGRLSFAAEMTDNPVGALARDTSALTASLRFFTEAGPPPLRSVSPAAGLPGSPRSPSPAVGVPVGDELLCEQLGYIEPPATRGEWLPWIGAIKATPLQGDGSYARRLEVAQLWSAGKLDRENRWPGPTDLPPGYYNEHGDGGPDVIEREFISMRNDHPNAKTYGSIKKAALDAGWTPPVVSGEAEFGAAVLASPGFFDPYGPATFPAFDPDWLDDRTLADFAITEAANIGVEVGAVAMPMFAAMSAAFDNRAVVNLKERGSFLVHPNLYVAKIGKRSSGKSPSSDVAVDPLYAIQNSRWGAVTALEQTKKAAAQLYKEQGLQMAPPPAGAEPRVEPVEFIVTDATVEAMKMVFEKQGRGFLYYRDELDGLIGSTDKYNSGGGGAADRSFLQQAWGSGQENTLRKVSKGSRADSRFLSILTNGHPEKVRETWKALCGGGFLQRFLIVMLGEQGDEQDLDGSAAAAGYANVLRDLTALGPGHFTLSADAHRVTKQLFDELNERKKLLGDTDISEAVGKLKKSYGSLLLLLHIKSPGFSAAVSGDAARKAAKIITDYAMKHANALYGEATFGRDVMGVADYVLAGDKPRYTTENFKWNVAANRALPSYQVEMAAGALVNWNWLIPDGTYRSAAWKVHPELRTVFHEHRTRLQERNLATQIAMNARGEFRPTKHAEPSRGVSAPPSD